MPSVVNLDARATCVEVLAMSIYPLFGNSDAHIDIDLNARLETEGEFSNLVTIFGWSATEPRL